MTPKLSLGQKQSRLVMLCLSPLYSPFFHYHLTFNKQPASVMHAGRAWYYWAILVICFDAECSPLMDDMHRARHPLSLPDTERASNRGQTLPIPTPRFSSVISPFLPSCLTLPLPCHALDQCVTPPSSTLIVSDYNITHPLSMVSFPAYNYILFLILSLQPDDATLLH